MNPIARTDPVRAMLCVALNSKADLQFLGQLFIGWLHQDRPIRPEEGGHAAVTVIQERHGPGALVIPVDIDIYIWDRMALQQQADAAGGSAPAGAVKGEIRRVGHGRLFLIRLAGWIRSNSNWTAFHGKNGI